MKVVYKFVAFCIYCVLTLNVGLSIVFAQSAGSDLSGVQGQATKVKLQLKWRHQFQFAGYYAALEKGFYRDANLDVSVTEYSSGASPIQQLMQGSVDFAVADTGALIYRSTGVPLVALAAIFQHSPSMLLVRADSGIKKLVDLRHRTLMVHGGNMDAKLKAMLQYGGLNLQEINLLPTETSPDALIEKRVDAYNAYTTNEPFFMEQVGIEYRAFYPRDYGVDFYGDILYTTERQISERPEIVERFRHASLKGWEYAVQNPEEVVDIILAKFNTQNKTREHLLFEAEQSIDLIEPNIVPIGYMSEQRWESIKEVFLQQGFFSQDIDLSDFIYTIDEFTQVFKVLERHRVLIFLLAIGLVGMLLLLHILSLKVKIETKTHELAEAKIQAEKEARTDTLTNLANRRSFFEAFSRDVALAARKKIPITLIAVDIDYFKSINDKFGHAAGDEALRQTSKIFKDHIRLGDIAARIGGEEFMLLCLNSSLEESRKFAERLRDKIEHNIIYQGDVTFNITCSFGIVEGKEGQSEDQMLLNADQMLYKAKRTGRNKVCIREN